MMNDQAEALRNLVRGENARFFGARRPQAQAARKNRSTRVLTVTSGKGGVGKSNFTLNFALQLQMLGYRVLVFDADIGMANIDVLMGATPQFTLYHLLKREKTIDEIVCRGYNDLQYIAGGSGFNDLIALTGDELEYFTEQVLSLGETLDFILFDTGAGLSKETFAFIMAADETIVVTTPEPTAITDAYALIKMVHGRAPDTEFKLVVNRASDRKEGQQTADKIRLVAQRFLKLDIPLLGTISDDANVSKAVKRQIPFTALFPDTAAARELKELTLKYCSPLSRDAPVRQTEGGGVKRFLTRIMQILK